MRGLEQIKEVNENPHEDHGEEHFGSRHVGRHPALDAEYTLTEPPKSSNVYKTFAANLALLTVVDQAIFGSKAPDGLVEQMAAVATVLDRFGVKHPADYDDARALAVKLLREEDANATSQDRIQPGIDQPPFLAFWHDLNARRERAGLPEAHYKEAKLLFEGGETPLGAMTFVGKQWEGLRAVPAKPVAYLGGHRPQYHGEHREITGKGTVWHKVTGPSGPTPYACPEAALVAAKDAKQALIDAKFR